MMKKARNLRGIAVGLALLLVFSPILTGCSKTQDSTAESTEAAQVTITDMAERDVIISGDVNKILALHPIPSYFLYRLAPKKVVSKDVVFDKRYLAQDSVKVYSDSDIEKLSKLPTTGVYFKELNPEQILQLAPDVVITLTKDPEIESLAAILKIPVIAVSKNTMADYEASMRLIGKVVGNEKEATELADYWHKTIEEVQSKAAQIPAEKKVKVFFAGASDILTTPGSETIMASIVESAGGDNVAKGLTGPQTVESQTVSMEQILKWNPEVIIVGTQNAKDKIMEDKSWNGIDAVKNSKVYVQPRYANLDGVTALMGLVWLEGKLYNNESEFNTYFAGEMKEFYKLFHNYQITNEQINEVTK
ncbi:MAG: ABC transporter substrate-binding protein [Syntrophomonadaceae bacterium]|nr:ABC transporter substrate-binding protein [Syntrophomonadaceae bacterium]